MIGKASLPYRDEVHLIENQKKFMFPKNPFDVVSYFKQTELNKGIVQNNVKIYIYKYCSKYGGFNV